MCLYPKAKHILVAGKDITVYKCFFSTEREGFLISPFQDTVWEIGKTKTVKSFGDEYNAKRRFTKRLPKYETVGIGRGLHAYLLKRTAKERFGPVVARCTIPKGTPYIIGSSDDIVSLALRVDKIVR